MRSQAALAVEHGVDGFVMHHYWFDGRKLLDTPLRNLLDDPSIEFPFALCWANENWTRSSRSRSSPPAYPAPRATFTPTTQQSTALIS